MTIDRDALESVTKETSRCSRRAPMTNQLWTTGVVKASDGYSMALRKYESPNPKGPVVACIHGIQSHAGWYERGCSAFRGFRLHHLLFRSSRQRRQYRRPRSCEWSLAAHGRPARLSGLPARKSSVVAAGRNGDFVGRQSRGGDVGGSSRSGRRPHPGGARISSEGPTVRSPTKSASRRRRCSIRGGMLPVPLSDPSLFTSSPCRNSLHRERFAERAFRLCAAAVFESNP